MLNVLRSVLPTMGDASLTPEMLELNQKIESARQAIQDAPDDSFKLDYLGNLLGVRYSTLGRRNDLEESIQFARKAISAAPSEDRGRNRYLNSLVVGLGDRYLKTGSVADLNEAIEIAEAVVNSTSMNDPNWPAYANNFASQLNSRFSQEGSAADLEKAIKFWRKAVEVSERLQTPQEIWANNLAIALGAKFQLSGEQNDFDEAIQITRSVLDNTAADHPHRARRLNTLANRLADRYARSWAVLDLEEAIEKAREAAALIPDDHLDRNAYLNNLALLLGDMYTRTGSVEALNTAIDIGQKVLTTTPKDEPSRAGRLNNLSIQLRYRYVQKKAADGLDKSALTDLDESIKCLREAVSLVGPKHPDRAQWLNNLGVPLGDKYKDTEDMSVLQESIKIMQEAVATLPENHADRAAYLNTLGDRLADRYLKTRAKEDLSAVISSYRSALYHSNSVVLHRMTSGRKVLRYHSVRADWQEAYQDARAAVELIHNLTERTLCDSDKQYMLGQIVGLASDAAATALNAGQEPLIALSLLEQGRSVLKAFLGEMRTDLRDLQAKRPDLAREFNRLGGISNSSGTKDLPGDQEENWPPAQDVATIRSRATFDLENLISEVREYSGCESFLLPPSDKGNIAAGKNGPIVVINVSELRSDGILIESSGLRCIPLPHLRPTEIEEMSEQVDRGSPAILERLWSVVAEPTLQALGYAAEAKIDQVVAAAGLEENEVAEMAAMAAKSPDQRSTSQGIFQDEASESDTEAAILKILDGDVPQFIVPKEKEPHQIRKRKVQAAKKAVAEGPASERLNNAPNPVLSSPIRSIPVRTAKPKFISPMGYFLANDAVLKLLELVPHLHHRLVQGQLSGQHGSPISQDGEYVPLGPSAINPEPNNDTIEAKGEYLSRQSLISNNRGFQSMELVERWLRISDPVETVRSIGLQPSVSDDVITFDGLASCEELSTGMTVHQSMNAELDEQDPLKCHGDVLVARSASILPVSEADREFSQKVADEEDRQSVQSIESSTTRQSVQSIQSSTTRQSAQSIESSTTLVSSISGYTSVEIASATFELRRILQGDQRLLKLYRLATENAEIGSDGLQQNLGRLLKQMSQDLRVEANKELEELASRFVELKARSMAHCIVEDLRVTRVVPQRPAEEKDGDSESDHEDNSINEDRFEDLTIFRTFLVESQAFQTFQSRLAAFVIPKPTQATEAKITDENTDLNEQRPESICRTGWFRNFCMAIRECVTTGFVEPQIAPKSVRVKWHCRCGDAFSSDVFEYRSGGIHRLKERMQRSGCRNVTITTCNQQLPRNSFTLQTPPWLQKVKRKMSATLSLFTRASPDEMYLPQHKTSNVVQASKATKPSKPVSHRELYLMSCIHRTQHHITVTQDLLEDITTDQQLFYFLKHQLKLYRGSFRNLLSMRRVQRIFFVKFRLHKNSVAQVRHHTYCCTQSICECIPPQHKVIKPPMGSGEYACNPSGPPDTWPPVCPEFMMHMFYSPQCIAKDDTLVLEQIPKKMDCRLDETSGSRLEGWGLYFQEDIDVSTIIVVLFTTLFVASLLFLIIWTVLKDDIQGASGVSAYIVAVASMAGIWVCTKSKSFG
ncbi:hypothetical protein C7974DRAFT_338546 [Boeremia exigua]|uniref:uncharacterized protein n=1 Tax=Boeremia exigua TaxID=749465 RepID=UPI001E8CB86F|nr:uncharacterized protein C7974DRAFT_338546 [Boeremia exigua]KAH6621811.1 hypothetical protein C7974DRAFT_338546 [Boeremia exigua]